MFWFVPYISDPVWNFTYVAYIRGGSRGCAPGARTPKIGKKYDFFGVRSWFFTRNTPKMFAPPYARRNFLKWAPPPNLKSWIHPCICIQIAIFVSFGPLTTQHNTTQLQWVLNNYLFKFEKCYSRKDLVTKNSN
jgi:hypothetical protein